MKRIWAVVALLFLTACNTSSEQGLRNILDMFIGKPEDAILLGFGIPQNVYYTERYKIVLISKSSSRYIPPSTYNYGNVYLNGRRNVSYFDNSHTYGGYTKHYNCDISFFIQNGIIVHYTLSGNSCEAPDGLAEDAREEALKRKNKI